MEWDTLLAPVTTGVTSAISDVVPLGVTVLVALAGITIVLLVLRKFGVRR